MGIEHLESETYSEDRGAALWTAVRQRDSRSDGKFVYAVHSTGIYCRPSCPSRRPTRDKVVFFALPEAAEREGFRPCKRCSPQKAAIVDPRLRAVSSVCRAIESSIAGKDADSDGASSALKLSALAKNARMSVHQLERAFRGLMGITPRQYADAQRMRRLKSQLRKGGNVTTALYDAGFGSSSRLYERAPSQLGMTPRTYRRGGEGMKIHYAIADSPLGRLLVGATETGISALYLGKSDAQLEKALREEYPRAEIECNGQTPAELRAWIERILAHLKGREPHLDLPTDVQATAFQRRVWEELRRIPYGSTLTYTQVAERIGQPTAVRAVARACATNPVSLVVPCHRVVRQSGNLAGYRWGLERKRALLDREAEMNGESAPVTPAVRKAQKD
jgi:AraC family transcriptional regulator, regulatory protein of adaptative response / methylated-DNA-[protein]-cysteine methyltransferase